ncbi:EI24 domain-containing protein [Microbacterium sp. RD1]|uniref:EI24 domain-containing protein n=1 Tax=Microbacterium sp. RD1 TaxID=3457313 RepID=UPI003FA58C0D
MREFGRGVRLLLRGFGFWRTRPGVMLWALVPAAVVALVLAGALGALIVVLPAFAETVTPFAAAWDPFWSGTLRVAVAIATLGAGIALAVVSFTALTLIVGEPFYDRVWRAVETDAFGAVPDAGYGFWRATGDAALLLLRGVGVALLAWLIGLVPLAGGLLAAVVGITLTGWLLGDELTSRALSARGIDRAARRRLLRGSRARALGFGVATQACFLIPLGAVAVMPAAVAGSTYLAHDLLGLSRPSSPSEAAPAARG